MKSNKMLFFIILSIALGILLGIYYPNEMIMFRWVGVIFINCLKLIVLPLIFCALVSAITSMQGKRGLGAIGFYTIAYVILSVSVAVCIGLFLLNVFKPGEGIPADLILANSTPADLKPVLFSSFLLTLFPPNILEAAVKFEIMPIVLFSVIFSIACLRVGDAAKPVIAFFIGMRDVLIKMIIWLMYLTPIGLLSLLGAAIAEAELQHKLLQSLRGMIFFICIFLFGLFFQCIWQFIIVKVLTGKRAIQFFTHAMNPVFTAFATSSSMATLPITLLAAKKQNINEDVARFVLPLATTINLAGTAMYEAVSALFFCQILGLHLSIYSQIGVFLTAIMAGMGATGIPEGGLVTMIMVLRSVNVPAAAIGLLLPFDRILDRFRTVVNVWGDLACAVTVNHFVRKRYSSSHERDTN